eukprot:2167037-Pleurochrysis_carterae.AAC.1
MPSASLSSLVHLNHVYNDALLAKSCTLYHVHSIFVSAASVVFIGVEDESAEEDSDEAPADPQRH